MSHRRVGLVCLITLGDYLLWNWSLNANHTVLALISGLTLPPLVLASVLLLALSLARLVSDSARSQLRINARSGDVDRRRAGPRRRPARAARAREHTRPPGTPVPEPERAPVSASSSAPVSGKRAA